MGYPAPAAPPAVSVPGHLVPVAFCGRTSTLLLQDPAASLRRQAREVQAKLPPGWFINAWFWDVESLRREALSFRAGVRDLRRCPVAAG